MRQILPFITLALSLLSAAAVKAETDTTIPPPILVSTHLVVPPLTPIPNLKATRKLAEAGDAAQQYWMGQYYLYGWSYDQLQPQRKRHEWEANEATQNLPLAIGWFERAAAQGNRASLNLLPVLYGFDSPSRNLGKVEYWLQKTAYADLPPKPWSQPEWTRLDDMRQAISGLCPTYEGKSFFREGVAGEKLISVRAEGTIDYAKAFTCRTYAIRVETSESAYKLAYFYQYGLGTPRDEDKAIGLYRGMLISESGKLNQYTDPHALIRLGLIYAGRGDDKEAYLWLKLAEDSLIRHKADPGDISSPEMIDANSSPEAKRRQNIYGLGSAALETLSTRLKPPVLAELDALVKDMRAKQAPVYVPAVPLDYSLTNDRPSDEGVKYTTADMLGLYSFRPEPGAKQVNLKTDEFVAYMKARLSDQTMRIKSEKLGWSAFYRDSDGKVYYWLPGTTVFVKGMWKITKVTVHAQGKSFEVVQQCNQYSGPEWTCIPASVLVALPEELHRLGIEGRRGDIFNLKSGKVPYLIDKAVRPEWPDAAKP